MLVSSSLSGMALLDPAMKHSGYPQCRPFTAERAKSAEIFVVQKILRPFAVSAFSAVKH
jgi:hypothetical protein